MVLSFLVLLAPLFISFALPSIVITSLWKKGAGRLADRLLVYPYYEPPHHNTNKMTVRQPKTQLRCVAKDLSFLHADNENSGQTGRLPRLIWVFTGRTCHSVDFVIRRLSWFHVYPLCLLVPEWAAIFDSGTSRRSFHCLSCFNTNQQNDISAQRRLRSSSLIRVFAVCSMGS